MPSRSICLAAGLGLLATSTALGQPSESEPVAVRTVAVVAESVRRTTTQPATLHAYHQAEIAARVGGYVKEILVDIGDEVAAGATLATIDAPELTQQLAVAQAMAASANAHVVRCKAEVRLAKARLDDAQSGVAEAESRIAASEAASQTAEAELGRTRQMVEQRSVQQRLLDEAQGRRDEAVANVEAARAVVSKARSRVGVAKAGVASAEADQKAAEAAVEVALARCKEAEVQLGFCRIRAPFDGVVTRRDIDPGDLAQAGRGAGDAPLFVMTQIDRVRVRTSVPEADAALVEVGDNALIQLATPGMAPVAGKVSRMSRALDPSTRTMQVEIEVANEERTLLPGMYGEATIVLHENPDALTLPASAVRFSEAGESYVYALDSDDKVTVVPIQIGADSGTRLEIVSPLVAGQRVVDAHLRRLTEGERVRVVD